MSSFFLHLFLKEGDLLQELAKISGLGPKTLQNLQKLGINNLPDLLFYFPFRYEVLTRTDLNEEKTMIDGLLISDPTVFYFNYKKNVLKFKLQIKEKVINVHIYNRAFLRPRLKKNITITVIGKYNSEKNTLVASDLLFGPIPEEKKITPIYHQTAELSNKKIINILHKALTMVVPESVVPSEIEKKYDFIPFVDALKETHLPTNEERLNKAIMRMKYEELFILMLKINFLRKNKKKQGLTRAVEFAKVLSLIKSLPFGLTPDQEKVIQEIYDDLVSAKRMNRLLQGDVGSGKTVVAILAMYINYLAGYSSALMAPTEVLAQQHYQTIKELVPDLKIVLLTSATKKKNQIKSQIKEQKYDIVIGTHALLTEDVEFTNLGLVITDEQHRFGVNQRKNLMNKGTMPDVLYMSATPIPRTYALTIYGDMDISSIKTKPANRKPVTTMVKTYQDLKSVLEMMFAELKKGHQIYVIAPLIDESEKSNLESANEIYQNMVKAFGKKYQVGLLHGRLKGEEKTNILNDFMSGQINILVSTTVIEVGIDAPRASMIIIYNSEMFGLSTLHQLRGRVGRGDLASKCILLTEKATARLKILEKTNDGFLISEEDFKLRGGGDLFGNLQSGDMQFKIADIKKDYSLLVKAKEDSAIYLDEKKQTPEIKKILNEVAKLA